MAQAEIGIIGGSGLYSMPGFTNVHEERVQPPFGDPSDPFVLAELDYMLGTRHGQKAQLALLEEVAEGAYELAEFSRSDVEAAAAVMRRYADLSVGLADASIVVLAERHRTVDVLSFDARHFRAMRGPAGRPRTTRCRSVW